MKYTAGFKQQGINKKITWVTFDAKDIKEALDISHDKLIDYNDPKPRNVKKHFHLYAGPLLVK